METNLIELHKCSDVQSNRRGLGTLVVACLCADPLNDDFYKPTIWAQQDVTDRDRIFINKTAKLPGGRLVGVGYAYAPQQRRRLITSEKAAVILTGAGGENDQSAIQWKSVEKIDLTVGNTQPKQNAVKPNPQVTEVAAGAKKAVNLDAVAFTTYTDGSEKPDQAVNPTLRKHHKNLSPKQTSAPLGTRLSTLDKVPEDEEEQQEKLEPAEPCSSDTKD